MNILVTGAHGFVGRNLTESLKNIRDGKDRTYPGLVVESVYECVHSTNPEELAAYAASADFVFHLAGVNRTEDPAAFMVGNCGALETLLMALKAAGNTCPVMLASSLKAALLGRYEGSIYGQSKLAGEKLLRHYGEETGAKTLIYRFPNVFGKWCRPNYNSAVATFCHNTARELPITVNDPTTELELLYIDDLVQEMLSALSGREHSCGYDGLRPVPAEDGPFCYVPVTHRATLGEIVSLLKTFRSQPETLLMPEIPGGSFAKKLYSTYLSYLPAEKAAFPLKMNGDARGSFTELLRTASCGQFSVNVSKPGITKGQHWHHTKWEFLSLFPGAAALSSGASVAMRC